MMCEWMNQTELSGNEAEGRGVVEEQGLGLRTLPSSLLHQRVLTPGIVLVQTRGKRGEKCPRREGTSK